MKQSLGIASAALASVVALGGAASDAQSVAVAPAGSTLVTPLLDREGSPVRPSTYPWNAWGYGRHFDDLGRSGPLTVDFETVALHLLALESASHANGLTLLRVIFDPPLQRRLADSGVGRRVLATVPFLHEQVWVRHDQHYHVDFLIR